MRSGKTGKKEKKEGGRETGRETMSKEGWEGKEGEKK